MFSSIISQNTGLAAVTSLCTLVHFAASDSHGPVCSAELYTCTFCSLYHEPESLKTGEVAIANLLIRKHDASYWIAELFTEGT